MATHLEAQNKSLKKIRIGLTIVNVILIILLFTVPLLRQEASQTSGFSKFVSVICWLASFGAIAFERWLRDRFSETLFYVIWFLGMGLGILFAIIGGI